MLRFRTIRQRPQRARKGQVAAVATIFGLLLVVTFVSNYLVAQLPGQLTNAEFNHVIQVENQLSRLQATILAQAANPGFGVALSAPVTLGSAAVPPFGPPAAGQVGPEIGQIRTTSNYVVSQVVSAEPRWNFGSSCISGGAGHCSGNGNIDTWNVTNTNNSAFTITVNGNRNSLGYNITGNNDTVNIAWTGGDTGFVAFIINGSNNIINYNKGGSDTTTPTAAFLFYGQNDVFNFNPSGSHSSKGGMTVYVSFVGSWNLICPYGNLSNTDKVGTLSAGGSNLNLTVVWWNALGYVSGPRSQTYPGGGGNNETIHWWNQSSPIGCAFTRQYASSYQTLYGSGVLVRLYNRYLPQTDVVYDQGAVIESQLGGIPQMVSGPSLSYSPIPAGFKATLTLVNLVGSMATETGLTTAAISTHVVSVSTVQLDTGFGSARLGSLTYLNVTTAYPAAWLQFFAGYPGLVPGGAHCSSAPAYSAPYSCLAPPPGGLSTISAGLFAQQLSLTTITVQVGLD